MARGDGNRGNIYSGERKRRTPEELAAHKADRAARSKAFADRRQAAADRRAQRLASDLAQPFNVAARSLRRFQRSGLVQPSARNQPVTEEMLTRLERRVESYLRRAEREQQHEALKARWNYKNEGTPETHEHASKIRQSALSRMHALGKISADDWAAAQEIAAVVEGIERQVGVRSASLEARVDHSGSGRDALVESLGRVRKEVAYRAWRMAIPHPKRMVLDMIVEDKGYVAVARRYRMHWRTARKILISALRMWPTFHEIATRDVDREDLRALYRRLGEGYVLPPRPRPQPAPDDAEGCDDAGTKSD